MLPAYRGRDCMEWAILNGDPAGISLILLDEGIDTGDIISVKDMPMSEVRTLEDLHAKAEVLKIEMITECINTGTFTEKKQRKDEGRNYRAMDSETKIN
jgi:methionyl-tRNA formyltransferase